MPSAATREIALERTQVLARPPGEVFAFFSEARNLEAITPPWLRFRIVEAPERLERGSLLRYRLRLFYVPFSWRTEIVAWKPPRAGRAAAPLRAWATFTDVQRAGPYPLWEHTHRFSSVEGGTEVYDHVRYRVPGGPLAPLVQRLFVGRRLDEIFDYRRDRLAELLGA
jgi:ligand-binding SRPBCC domain-containing protein